MIPEKIKLKIDEKCQGNRDLYSLMMDLLEYEDSGSGKQIIYSKKQFESYYEKVNKDED